LFLHAPERCEACQARGSVRLDNTPIGSIVALRWTCQRCGRQWATTTAEMQPDRRTGLPDSRWTPQNDRRQRV
jgi:hypothetical protein